MGDDKGGQRVIGIRHTLKKIKEAGLIEDDRLYPDDAIGDLQDGMLSTAQKWYKIGAKRGALEVLETFLDGTFVAERDSGGKITRVANATDSIEWERTLNVKVGNARQTIPKQAYRLTLKKLVFN